MSASPRILLPVAVDPRALLDFRDVDHSQTHESMVAALLDHAVLTLGDGDARALFNGIDQLSSYPKSQWNELLIALSAFNRLDNKETLVESVAEFLAGLTARKDAGELVRVAIVGKADAGAYEEDLRSGSSEVNGTEMVRPSHLNRSKALKSAREIGSFPKETPRETVARELIVPLAARSQVVKILDPHLMDHILRTASGRPYDHTEWLVSTLARAMPAGAAIELIADAPTARTTDDDGNLVPLTDQIATTRIGEAVEVALRQTLDRGATRSIRVRTTLVRGHRNKNPNRYMSFSCGATFEVSHDFTRLGAPLIWERMKFTRQRGEDAEHVAQTALSYENFGSPGGKLQVNSAM